MLKKRAEQTRLDSDSEINWADVGDIGEGSEKAIEDDIPKEVQDKLLNDYERELIKQKLDKGTKAEDILASEVDKLSLRSNKSSPGSSQEKGEKKRENEISIKLIFDY